MTNDELLRGVLESPDEDSPRLVYADWLEENKQQDRAKFIRVQIELAGLQRERDELLSDAETDWRECTGISASWCPNCGDCTCPYPEDAKDDPGCPLHNRGSKHDRLGMIDDYYEPTLVREQSELFADSGPKWWHELPGAWRATAGGRHLSVQTADGWDYHVERGFVELVEMSCQGFLTHAKWLFANHPVVGVTLTDRVPIDDTGAHPPYGQRGYFYRNGTGNSVILGHDLPGGIFAKMKNRKRTRAGKHLACYDTREQADKALCDACVRFGCQEAGVTRSGVLK